MSKEEKIHEYENKRLIDELSKMPPMVLATAYLHAINYTLYGEDVTEKWVTAIQNTSALEKAYRKGYYDGSLRQAESYWIPVSERLPEDSDTYIVTIKSHTESKPYTDVAIYNAVTKQWEDEPCNEYYLISDITNEVIAWMPLPEPYKEKEKEYGKSI